MIRRILVAWSEFYQSLRHPLPRAEVARIRRIVSPGDVIVTHNDFQTLERIIPSYWTHAAVYAGSVRGVRSVVQARLYGVHMLPLTKVLRATRVAVLRPELPAPARRAAARSSLSFVGRPFDLRFDFSDDSRLVCTELPLALYRDVLGLRTRPRIIMGMAYDVAVPDDFFVHGFRVMHVSP